MSVVPKMTDRNVCPTFMIIGIVAVDQNGAIGKGGKLPWHYSADMKFFKETTTGNAVAMGRKTWLTLKKPLPNRLNIVLSRRAEIEPEDSVRDSRHLQRRQDAAIIRTRHNFSYYS